jgi:hypothetical protein
MGAYFKYSRWDGHPARQLLTGDTPVPPGAMFPTALAVSESVTVFRKRCAKELIRSAGPGSMNKFETLSLAAGPPLTIRIKLSSN